MEIDSKRCSVEINLTQFKKNCELVKNAIPSNCKLMTVLKGNAYGHGIERITEELKIYPDDWIAVATLGEALKVRNIDKNKNILILGYTPPENAKILSENNITQSIISYNYAFQLSNLAKDYNCIVPCHLALDTGMSRIGLISYGTQYADSFLQAVKIYNNPYLNVTGIFTHFSSAYGMEDADDAYTKMQYKRFITMCNDLKNHNIEIGIRHCNNSPSIINYPEFSLDMCRGGTLLFGLFAHENMRRPIDLQVVMKFKTTVTMIKEIEPGAGISYNRTAVADKKLKLAVLSVGWYDGYPRMLGNIGKVLIRGKVFPIIGKICMDICMVNITGNNTIKEGDEAVLLGKQGENEIKCRQLYKPIGMGPGSISSGISERVPRIYVY